MREFFIEARMVITIGMATFGLLAFTENGEQATKIKEQQAIISLLCEASPQCKEGRNKWVNKN